MYLHENLQDKFILNKYTKWYFSIINNASSRTKRIGLEHHHILPKSVWPEYIKLTENPWNGVYLTYKEHFICHWLLTKMTGGGVRKTMWRAMWRITNKDRSKRNSIAYIAARKQHCIFMTENNPNSNRDCSGKNNPNYGKKNPGLSERNRNRVWTTEMREKLSKSKTGQPGQPGWKKGLTKETDERLMKLSNHHKGKVYTTPEQRKTQSKMMLKNNPMNSAESREKVRQSKLGSKNPRAFAVTDGNTIFECYSDAAEYYNVTKWTIGHWMKNKDNWIKV